MKVLQRNRLKIKQKILETNQVHLRVTRVVAQVQMVKQIFQIRT